MHDPPVPLSEMSPQLSNSAMDITEHGRNARSTDRKSALAGFLNRRKNLSGSWGSRARQPRQSASSVFAGSAESLPDPQEDTSLRTMSLDRLNRQKPTSKRTYGIRSSSLDRMLDEDGNDLGDTDEAAQEEETPLRTASLDRLDRQRTPQSRRTYGFKSTSLQQPSDNDPGSFDENGEQIPEENNADKTPQRTGGSLDRLNRQGSAYDRANRVKAASLEEFRQSLRSLTLKKPTGREEDQQQEQEHAEHHEERQVTTSEPTQKTPVRKNLTPFIKFSPAFLEQERSKQVMPPSPTPAMTVTDGQQSRLDDARQRANQLEELLKSKRQKMEEAKKQVRKIHRNLEDELTKQEQTVTNGSSREDESVVIDFSKSKGGDKSSKPLEETTRENGWSTAEFGRDSASKTSNHEETENKKGASDDQSTKVGSEEEETFNDAKKLLLRTEGSHRDQPIAPSFISFEGGDDGVDGPVTPPPLSRNDPLPELLAPPNDFNPGNPFDLFLDSLGLPVMQEEWIEERRPSLSTIYEEDEPLSDSTANSSVIDLTVEEGSIVGEDSKDERGVEEEDRDEKKALNAQEAEVKQKVEDSHIEERLESDEKEKLEDDMRKEDAGLEDVKQVTETEGKVEEVHPKEEDIVEEKEEKLEEETGVEKVNVWPEPQDMTGSTQKAQEDVSDKDKKMEETKTDVTDGEQDSAMKETVNNITDHENDSLNHVEEKDEGNDEITPLAVKDDIPEKVKELNNAIEEKDGVKDKTKEESEDTKVGGLDVQKTSEVTEEKALSSNNMAEEKRPQLIEKETHAEENKEIVGEEAKKEVANTHKEDIKEEDTDATETTVKSHDDVGQQSKETSENEDKQKVEEIPKVQEDTSSIHTEEISKEKTNSVFEKTQDSSIQKENDDIANKSEAVVKENPKKMPVVEITVNLKASEIGPDLLNELVAAKSPTSVAPPPPNVSKSPKVSKKTYKDKTKATTISSKEKDKSKKNKNFMEEINALLEQTESTMVRRSTEITSVSEDLQNTAKTLFNLEVEETVFTTSPNTTGSSHDLSGSVSSLDSTTEDDKGQTSVTSPERHPVKGPELQSSVTTPERQSDSGNGSLNDSPFSVRTETLDKSPSPVEPLEEDIKKTKQEAEEEQKKQEPAKEQIEEAMETEKEATDVSEKDNSEDRVSKSSAMEFLHQKKDTEKETSIESQDTNHNDTEQNDSDTAKKSNKPSEREESPSQKLDTDKDITITSKQVNLQDNLKQDEPETKSDESKSSLEKENPTQKLETDDDITTKSEESNLEQDRIQEEPEMMRNETRPPSELKTKPEITKEAEKSAYDSPKPSEKHVVEHHSIPNGKVSSESTEQERRHTSTSRVEMNVILVQDKEAKAVSEETTTDKNERERREPDIISDMPKVARSVELFESLLKSDNHNKKDRVTMAPIPSNIPVRDEEVDATTKDEVQLEAKTEQKQTTVEPESQKDDKQEISNTQLPVPVDEEGEVIEGIYTASLVYVGGSSFEESGGLSPRNLQTSESFAEDDNIPVFSPTDKSTPARDGIFKAQLVQVNSLSFEEDPEESIGSEDSSNASVTSSSPSYELVRDEKGWKGKPRHSTPTGQEDSTSPGPEDSSLRRGRSMRRRSQRKSFEGSLWDDEDFKHKVSSTSYFDKHSRKPCRWKNLLAKFSHSLALGPIFTGTKT
ncbi:PREDICTED: titin homolog [Branchiostoma belcheri]|uniref:Titin homolog n=1 Tax=Branchiostoma belcheri TaxID=7741 RepID=A0A6P5AP02_BRABE|nr:PREDICTED: titin homolog [Branchiostoma belcheri]